MSGIMSAVFMCFWVLFMKSPMMMALMLCMMSLMVSMMIYSTTLSVFCATAIMISFSSGMMIILCYCTMSCNFECKNSLKKTEVLIVSMLIATLTTKKMTYSFNQEMVMKMLTNSMTILMMMSIIFMTVKAINISMINPTKSLMVLYS